MSEPIARQTNGILDAQRAELARARALLSDVYAALLRSGWHEDQLLERVRLAKAEAAVPEEVQS